MSDLKFAVSMPGGSIYNVSRLLAKGSQNTKTAKSDAASQDYLTYSLSLAPALASGFNLCPSASKHCINSCIYTSGLAQVHPRTILPARIAKARMLRLHKNEFIARLFAELKAAQRVAAKKNRKLAVRLNVFSDVQWEKEVPSLFTDFPDITWYDYTKIHKRMLRYLSGQFPTNYHLTFSWSGTNKDQCLEVLRNGGNVAIPFHVQRSKPLPNKYLGRPVIDGDLTDLRFLDKTLQRGIIVGLRAKGRGRKDKSNFVVSVK